MWPFRSLYLIFTMPRQNRKTLESNLEAFTGPPTGEPAMLAWMPAASVYFRDPDNNLLEIIAMLTDPPRPDLGVFPWSDWIRREKTAV